MANETADDAPALWRPNLSPETGRIIAAAAMAIAPALGFAFAPAPGAIAAGLSICAALMVVSFRPLWRAAAWVGVLGAAGWAAVAFAMNAAEAAPLSFSLCCALAAAAGLVHARLCGVAPGATLALAMAVALLVLGAGAGMVGPAGVSFGAVALAAAVIGASALRVEGLLIAAFIGTGVALYLLSGQEAAAIWFTPATTWAGAIFFAIAAVRAPQLGPRAVLVSGIGAAAPILAAAALFSAQQGLADKFSAAGVFASLSVMLFGLLGVCAQRRRGGISGLKLTAWILAGAAIIAAAFASMLAAPVAFTATVLGAMALAFTAIDQHYPDGLWRGAAIGALLGAAYAGLTALQAGWPSPLTISAAFVVPALCGGACAYLAQSKTPATATFFEAFTTAAALTAALAVLRFALSAGEPNAAPLGFIEAGAGVAVVLAVSLILALRSDMGAAAFRRVASAMLGCAAICAAAVAGLLWLTPYWLERAPTNIDWPLLQHAPLGFALPAILAWAHWAFWRQEGAHLRTRAALVTAALLTAAFITQEVFLSREAMTPAGVLDGVSITALVLSFACAIGVNFAPGVTAAPRTRSNVHEYFQRNRRS